MRLKQWQSWQGIFNHSSDAVAVGLFRGQSAAHRRVQ
jgi:hypothetical protein